VWTGLKLWPDRAPRRRYATADAPTG
jgi:hypothetical protein